MCTVFICLFILSFSIPKCLCDTECVPGTVLGTGDTAMSKAEHNLAVMEFSGF